ncbi:unnamed protein product, partial [Staurois parvus]
VDILTLGGTDLVSLTSPVTPIQRSVLKEHCTNGTGQEGVNMRGDQKVNCVLGVFYYGAVSVCFTVITLLWLAVLCKAIQSSMSMLTGERPVLFPHG